MATITFQPSRYLLGLALCCTLSFDAFSAPQESKTPKKTEPRQEALLVFRGIDPTAQQRWVDSVYKSLDLEGRVGQLIMPIIYPRPEDKSALLKRMKQEKWGGILFQKGFLADQRDLTQTLQEASTVPMLIALDGEWGLYMRLKDAPRYPRSKGLGIKGDMELIKAYGAEVARQCQLMGIHINFAPVVDVNINPKNPVIGTRSFGDSPELVARCAVAYGQGLEEGGVLSVAKHFPGHGDTEKDSHKTLPTVSFSRERLESTEFFPFQKLIGAGVASLMVGHLNVPALDEGKPASISYKIVSGLIKQQLGFQGLIFSDALGMKGVADYAESSQVDLQAFLAGNDVLLMSSDPIKGIETLKNAYSAGTINEYRLAHSVKKILKAKYWAGLNKYKPVALTNLTKDLNTKEDDLLTEKIYEKAITLVQNAKNVLPLKNLDTKKTAYIKFGDDSGWEFFKNLRYYQDVVQLKSGSWESLKKEMAPYDRIIIGLHRSNASP